MDHEEVKKILLKKYWKKTKTFKTYPHSYSLEENWDDKILFKKVWNFINYKGEERVFFRRVYRYYKIDDYEYWAMYTHNGQGIINRTKI